MNIVLLISLLGCLCLIFISFAYIRKVKTPEHRETEHRGNSKSSLQPEPESLFSSENELIAAFDGVTFLLPRQLNITSTNIDCLRNQSLSAKTLFSTLHLNDTNKSIRVIHELSLTNTMQILDFFRLIDNHLEQSPTSSCPFKFKLNVSLSKSQNNTFSIVIGKGADLSKNNIKIEIAVLKGALDKLSGHGIISKDQISSIVIALSRAELELILAELVKDTNNTNEISRRRKRSIEIDTIDWILKFINVMTAMTIFISKNITVTRHPNNVPHCYDMRGILTNDCFKKKTKKT